MPVSLSGVMLDGRTLYSAVSQTCGPPAWRFEVSSTPPGPRGVWQLPQVRTPSTRYLPRSSGVCASALLISSTSEASESIARCTVPPVVVVGGRIMRAAGYSRPDVRFLHDPAPLQRVGPDLFDGLLRRQDLGIAARGIDRLERRLVGADFRQRLRPADHDLCRQPRGTENPVPSGGIEAFEACFVHRRHVRKRGRALR